VPWTLTSTCRSVGAALALAACAAGNAEQSPLPGGSASVGVHATVSFSGALVLQGSGALSGGSGSVCNAPNAVGSISGHTVHITLITEAAPFGTPLLLTGYAVTIKVDTGSWSIASGDGAAGGSLLLTASGGTLTFHNFGSDLGGRSTLSGTVAWTCG
jgi:hypothetical protein